MASFAFHALAWERIYGPFRPPLWEKPNANQKLVQCWFPGDHIDSGAGGHDRQIHDITLAWMMTQMEKNRVLKFKPITSETLSENLKKWPKKKNMRYKNGDLVSTRRLLLGILLFNHACNMCLNQRSHSLREALALAGLSLYDCTDFQPGETASMYNLISDAVGRLAIGSVMGSKPRDLGNYQRLHPDGSRSSNLLENTGECTHKSVGVRLKAKTGLAADGKNDYAPKALDNWSAPSEGRYKWNRWWSHTPTYLEEPLLEGHEKEMFKLYEDAANKPATAATRV